jgi:hypothetical protein
MQKLSAVPWLSRSCRTLISFLIALALVFSAFAVLKIASRAKQTRVDEFTTGSIQKSSAVRKSETKGRMVSYVDPTVSLPRCWTHLSGSAAFSRHQSLFFQSANPIEREK